MQSVVHFEMPYEDGPRVSKFYSDVFGWKTQQMGADMGDYIVIETTEGDPKTHRPLKPGAINGGLFKKSDSNRGITVVIAVEDIEEAMKKVEAGGGKLIGGSTPGKPDDIPGVGKYIAIEDPEGNRVALLQPSYSM